MKITLRRSRSGATTSDSFLGKLARQLGRGLAPAPALVPAGASLPLGGRGGDTFHPVFGRRRDEGPRSDEPDEEVAGEQTPEQSADEIRAPLPPSAEAAGEDRSQEAPESAADDVSETAAEAAPEAESEEVAQDPQAAGGSSSVESSWSGYEGDPTPAEPSPFSFDAGGEHHDLPAWTPSPLTESAFSAFPPESEEGAPAAPWSAEPAPEAAASFPGGEYREGGAEDATWPAPEGEGQVWSPPPAEAQADETPKGAPVPDAEFATADSEPALEGLGEEPAAEVEPGGPAAEGESAEGVAAEVEVSWAAEPAAEAAEPSYIGFVQEAEVSRYAGAVALVEDARAFPLPEGEILFRNLRAGFTDPARLLRHLAGEGHTGVMHVAAVDARNTYVVLVDGYVVAVASDTQGRLTTTNRVSFPNFPNSQDILNVITYPREIARGLGLLLHAPVHFRGLGAMFVNLDGLRSYLSKHSACGGMVVAADSGTGVALFDEGRLVGTYSDNQVVETDLAPLRELIKDLDAEIDVRFGGPKDLEPLALDTLLAGYPL